MQHKMFGKNKYGGFLWMAGSVFLIILFKDSIPARPGNKKTAAQKVKRTYKIQAHHRVMCSHTNQWCHLACGTAIDTIQGTDPGGFNGVIAPPPQYQGYFLGRFRS